MRRLYKNLTKKQLYEACQKHEYLLLRYYPDNSLVAVNTRIARFKKFDIMKYDEKESNYSSFIPCTFSEYITYKTPFI